MKLESRALIITTSSTEISPIKGSRGYMGVQNNDSTNFISVHFGDAAATLLNGVIIQAGEFYEIAPGIMNISKVSAIADTASVATVIVEG